jgi:hypothetical protein
MLISILVEVKDESALDEANRRVLDVILAALRDMGVTAPDVETRVQYPEIFDDGAKMIGGVQVSLRGVAAMKETTIMAALVAAGFDPGQFRRKAEE